MFLNPSGPRLAKPLWQAWRFGKLGANGKNEPCWRKTRKAIRRSMQAQACDSSHALPARHALMDRLNDADVAPTAQVNPRSDLMRS